MSFFRLIVIVENTLYFLCLTVHLIFEHKHSEVNFFFSLSLPFFKLGERRVFTPNFKNFSCFRCSELKGAKYTEVGSCLLPGLLDRPEVQITVTSRDSVRISPGNTGLTCVLVIYSSQASFFACCLLAETTFLFRLYLFPLSYD